MNKVGKIISAACCASMLFGMAACGGSDSSSGEVKLEFLTGMATGSAQLKAMTTVVNAFEKENPTVKVTLVPGTSSYESDLKVRLAGRNAPDLWNTHGWSRDRYADFLEPLQGRSWAKNMSSVIDTAIRKDDKSFYALPLDVAVTGIIYNTTVLDKAGVDPKTITSWDDFDAACQKVVATGANCLAASGKDNWTVGNIADYTASGMYTGAQLKELKNGSFDSAAYEKAVTPIYQWARNKYFNVDYTSATADDVAKLAATDKVGFVIQPNSFVQSVESYSADAKLGVMPIPSAVGDPYLVTGEDYAIGASKTGKNKETALKLIDFMAEPENMKTLSDTTGNAPAISGVEANIGQLADTYNYWVEEKKTQTYPIFDRVYLPNGMWNTLCTTTDGLLTGQSDPGNAASQMKTSFESLYGQS
ncbi:ABC transporter substrate-binding protein [Bifidobacterium crudilactis]|jgi:raffinose/stachyose/melibiose transport system substrate-binding protein|uniref:ABC transporter substrate-binding protein n=1 Tax=Bifidobacterium crudilactis TaxID=327277 RepID=UPI0023530452|nr:ABC transporter substrate-binding protein [Bifidobacterium crudilactis]MCI1217402.1 ABC transporter substrate-binding protein [Bifidobacterium crudilactis]MCI1636513.1 ABC transporter substrate-binding protein [Bifidobacterium crudilactis]